MHRGAGSAEATGARKAPRVARDAGASPRTAPREPYSPRFFFRFSSR